MQYSGYEFEYQIAYRKAKKCSGQHINVRLWLAALLTLILICGLVPAQQRERKRSKVLNFTVTPTLEVGEAPEALAIADFNGDNNLDLIVGNARDHNLTIFIGDNKGRLRQRRTLNELFGGLLAGDFNNDNLPDLLLVDGSNNHLQVLLNEGKLSFRPQAVLPLGGTLASIIGKTYSLGDFNGDRLLDVAAQVITPAGRWQIFFAFGLGNGELTEGYSLELTSPPLAQASMDANSDKITDLAIVTTTGFSLILGNTQTTAFVLKNRSDTLPSRTTTVADFNRDTNIDVALINDDGTYAILAGDSNGEFSELQTGKVQGYISTAVAADFNGDNLTDLALIRSIGDVALLLGQGDGRFAAARYFTLSGTNTLVARAADLNSDGRNDLIAANTDTNNVAVLYGYNGGFQAPRHHLMNSSIAQATYGDFDADGLLDLILTEQQEESKVHILSGNGQGDFTLTISFPGLAFPGGLTTADLDNDQRLDLVATSSSTDRLGLRLSSRSEWLLFDTGYHQGGPADPVVGDFDADGLSDIAVANTNALGGPKTITIFFGLQGDRFQRLEQIPLQVVPHHMVGGDFNGDGIKDLATETCCPRESLLLLLGVHNGTPKAQELLVPKESLWGLVAADFNSDSITDLAFTDPVTQEVIAVTLGQQGQPTNIERIPLDLPYMISASDINNDRVTDLVVLGNKSATILTGNGNGGFLRGPAIPVSAALSLLTGDFNNDNHNDLIVVGRDYLEPILSQNFDR
ncbi:MAG: VCBS repeat-containing protein [Acidobacteriota bacterium]